MAQLMPKKFETHSRSNVPPRPQKRDQFAESPDAPASVLRSRNQLPHELDEQLVIRPLVHHEFPQGFLGKNGDILVLRSGLLQIYTACPQPLCKSLEVLACGEHDNAFPLLEPSPDKSRQRIEQHCVVLIKLSEVLARRQFTPKDRARSRRDRSVTAHWVGYLYARQHHTSSLEDFFYRVSCSRSSSGQD